MYDTIVPSFSFHVSCVFCRCTELPNNEDTSRIIPIIVVCRLHSLDGMTHGSVYNTPYIGQYNASCKCLVVLPMPFVILSSDWMISSDFRIAHGFNAQLCPIRKEKRSTKDQLSLISYMFVHYHGCGQFYVPI